MALLNSDEIEKLHIIRGRAWRQMRTIGPNGKPIEWIEHVQDRVTHPEFAAEIDHNAVTSDVRRWIRRWKEKRRDRVR